MQELDILNAKMKKLQAENEFVFIQFLSFNTHTIRTVYCLMPCFSLTPLSMTAIFLVGPVSVHLPLDTLGLSRVQLNPKAFLRPHIHIIPANLVMDMQRMLINYQWAGQYSLSLLRRGI
jgi:hypothetical protein